MAKSKAQIKLETEAVERIAEIKELKQKLADQVDADAVKPFVIPEEITEPRGKLIFALADLTGKLEAVQKRGDAGTGSFSYKFASVFDMIDQVRPLMSHRGLVFTGTMLLDHPKYMMTEVATRNGTATELMLPTEWELEHIAGGVKTITIMGQAIGNDDKAHGKAFTASQKLALRSMTAISTGDEDDIEHDQIEKTSGNSQRSNQQPRNSGVNPRWGECPEHKRSGFYLTRAAKDAGHGASHKIDGGSVFCEYAVVNETTRSRFGSIVSEHFGKSPGKRFLEWLTANKLVIPALGRFSEYRPQDWIAVAGKLSSNPPTPLEAIDAPADKPAEPEQASELIDGQMVCGNELEVAGIPMNCMLPPGHSEDIEHDAEPTLEAIAAVQAAQKS